MIISHLPSDLFHKIHMKSKEIILFVKKVIIRKVSFIHSYIEELVESLIEFSIKVRRFNLKKQQPWFESNMKSPHYRMLINYHVNK